MAQTTDLYDKVLDKFGAAWVALLHLLPGLPRAWGESYTLERISVAGSRAWAAPIVLGSLWPVLYLLWWRQPVLALIDLGAVLSAAAAYTLVILGRRGENGVVLQILFAAITVCLAAIEYLTGGITSPNTPWLLLVPLATTLWMGRRTGVAWTAINAVLLVTLLLVAPDASSSRYIMPASYRGAGLCLSLTTLLVILVAVIDASETGRAQSLEALRLAEAKYRSLVEQMPAVTYVTSLDGSESTQYLIPRIEEMLGFTAAEWMQDAGLWMRCLHPEDREGVVAEYRRHLANAEPFSMEYRYLARDGRVVWVRDEAVVVRDADGKPLFLQGIMLDISQHKRLQEQLMHAQRIETVGTLAGGVAHDFNNLLTAIIGHATFALDDMTDPKVLREDIEEVLKAAERAQNLTSQLLAFSRRQILATKVTSLNDLVLDMDKMLRRLIGERIELVTIPAPDLGMVKVDRGQIEQVLVNLVVNARDAIPDVGTVTIETANAMLDESYLSKDAEVCPGPYVMLAVSDTGMGMSEEVKAHLFEPFYTTKEVGKGTGLGLATVYGIVKQHQGHIWVYSELGKGSTFKVYLPLVQEAASGADVGGVAPAEGGAGQVVLVVEDEPAVRSVAGRILHRLGYTVLQAGNGEEALRLAEENAGAIHLLITDVVMPRMSGKELADRLKTGQPTMKVLFVSGYTDNDIHHHGVLDEDVDFLQKPFTEAALACKVREVLG